MYFLAITPTIFRWEVWPKANLFNSMVEEYSRTKSNLVYLDAASAMLNGSEIPNKDFLWWDGTHLNKKGYELWIALVKNALQNDGFIAKGVDHP